MKFLLVIFFITSLNTYAQWNDLSKQIKESKAKLQQSSAYLDSVMKESNRRLDSINMANFNEQNTRNLDAFVAMQRESERKQKKAMILRLGFGIVMLGILVVGLRRKKKNQSSK